MVISQEQTRNDQKNEAMLARPGRQFAFDSNSSGTLLSASSDSGPTASSTAAPLSHFETGTYNPFPTVSTSTPETLLGYSGTQREIEINRSHFREAVPGQRMQGIGHNPDEEAAAILLLMKRGHP